MFEQALNATLCCLAVLTVFLSGVLLAVMRRGPRW